MARQVNILYSPEALRSLDAIWLWNAEKHGPDHADKYVEFLRESTRGVASSPLAGSMVPARPDLRYVLIRKRRRGHGHVVVYRLETDSIQVISYFHTAQDWQSRLSTK